MTRSRGTPWSRDEDTAVCANWGIHSVSQIANALGRTPLAVYYRATHDLQLGGGCPQGFELIGQAAQRCGFHHATLLRILYWAHVKIRPAASRPGSGGRNHIVEPHDVDQAVASWLTCETLAMASRRLGYAGCTLREWIEDDERAGLVSLPDHVSDRHWRVPQATLDAVVSRRMGRETKGHASRRHGVSVNTMTKWLREAGVSKRVKSLWLLDPAEVDRVVESRRARAA